MGFPSHPNTLTQQRPKTFPQQQAASTMTQQTAIAKLTQERTPLQSNSSTQQTPGILTQRNQLASHPNTLSRQRPKTFTPQQKTGTLTQQRAPTLCGKRRRGIGATVGERLFQRRTK